MKKLQLGIYSFGDFDGDQISGSERMENLVEEIVTADKVGLDIFGVGEHHRDDFVVSSPVVPLAAAAALTKHIRLTSAVSVISSDDPVRVFQQFSELDLISKGRAEIMVGRGSFIESFPLFGYSLSDYDDLFDEKLGLLLKIREEEIISWSGTHRATISERGVYPRPLQKELPIWIAVGGNQTSVIRAAVLGLPMALAIIGGPYARFLPLVDLYRETAEKVGKKDAIVSINSQGFIGEDGKKTRDFYFPYYEKVMNKIGEERGWPKITREVFEAACGEGGSLFVGSVDEIVGKIVDQYKIFRNERFLLQIDVGMIPHKEVLKAIELFGKEVMPKVDEKICRLG